MTTNAGNGGRTSNEKLEQFAVAILCCVAVAAPAMLGSTGPWPRFGVEASIAAAAVAWAASNRRQFASTALAVSLVAVVLVQLIPLPDAILVAMAPVSAGAWKVAMQGAGQGWGTISIDPGATAVGIRRLFLALVAIAIAADLGRQLRYRRQIITAITISGLLVWGSALAFPVDQKQRQLLGVVSLDGPSELQGRSIASPVETPGYGSLTPVILNGKKYLADEGGGGDGFGPYICSNHFAGAMCLTLPVALAAWFYVTRSRLPNWSRYGAACLCIGAALWTVGVEAKSRAGTAALFVACVTVLMLCVERRSSRRLMEALAATCVLAMATATAAMYGFFGGIQQHLPAGLQKFFIAATEDTRVAAARIGLRMFRASPLFGTGLNTYGELFPRFFSGNYVIYYAHNDYAQFIAETGLVGVAAALALASVIFVRATRFYRFVPPAGRTLEAGPWAAVVGIAVHSAFDWNLHVPANGLLACLVVGLAAATGLPPRFVGKAQPEPLPDRGNRPGVSRRKAMLAGWLPLADSRAGRLVFATLCVGVTTLLFRDALSAVTARSLRYAVTTARLAATTAGSPEVAHNLQVAIKSGERMDALDRSNAELARLLGQAELHLSAQNLPPEQSRAAASRAQAWFATAKARSAGLRGVIEIVD
jgi:O-antigen ligase